MRVFSLGFAVALVMGAGLVLAHCCKGVPESVEEVVGGGSNPVAPVAAAEPTKYDMRFGVSEGLYPRLKPNGGAEKMRSITAELDKLGNVWLRNPGRGNSWWEVQPNRETFDYSKLDAVLDGNDHPWVITLFGGMGVPYVFDGDFSPEKMRQAGKRGLVDAIKDNPLILSDPQHRADAENYVKTTVNTFKDRIKYWEIGNEGIGSPHRLEVIQHTYAWVKEADPDAQVLMTAPAGAIDERYHRALESVDRLLTDGAAESFDIGNLHYYGTVGSGVEGRIERAFDAYAEILARHGQGDKPIWVTETGASSDAASKVSGSSSEAVQARQMVKRLVIFSAQGAERVFWHNYALSAPTSQFSDCNVVDERTRAVKPAYHAFKLVVDKIGFYTTVEALQRDGTTYLYRFTNPDGGVVLVGWSHDSTTVDCNAYLGSKNAQITRLAESGASTSPTESVSAKAVPLGASPIFIESN